MHNICTWVNIAVVVCSCMCIWWASVLPKIWLKTERWCVMPVEFNIFNWTLSSGWHFCVSPSGVPCVDWLTRPERVYFQDYSKTHFENWCLLFQVNSSESKCSQLISASRMTKILQISVIYSIFLCGKCEFKLYLIGISMINLREEYRLVVFNYPREWNLIELNESTLP